MPMTNQELGDLLTVLASLDSLHTTQSQEKFAQKVDAWALVLNDVEYRYALQTVQMHYQDPNAKSLTAGVLRTKALRLVPAPPRPPAYTPAGLDALERACRWANCRCPHTRCRDGWLDEEGERVNRFGAYVAVKRCPACTQAMEAVTGG